MSISLFEPNETTRLTAIDLARIQAAWDNASAGETRRVYAHYRKRFEAWCTARGCSALPAEPVVVAGYLAEMAETSSWSAVQTANAAIRARHEEVGLVSPTLDYRLSKVRKGIHNTISRVPRQADGITLELFLQIERAAWKPRPHETMAQAGLRASTDIALISLMRDCLLRRLECELATWSDLVKLPDGTGSLAVRRVKTRKRQSTAPGYVSLHTMVYLLRMLELRKGPAPEPFEPIFGIGGRQISNRIQQAAEWAGLSGRFRGHSPRIGMAHDLAAGNAELPSLMQAGGWSSGQSVSPYIATVMASKSVVAGWYQMKEDQLLAEFGPSHRPEVD